MASGRCSQKDEDRYGQCTKVVMSRDNGLQCELCEMWFHSACEGIDDEVYKVLCKSESVHWFCKKCNTV